MQQPLHPDPNHASILNLAEAASSLIPVSHPPPSNSIVSRALTDGEKPAKRGSNLACLKCRAIKVRCSRASPQDDKCKRCTRLNLECEFKEHHRGRKPKKRLKTQYIDYHHLSPSSHNTHTTHTTLPQSQSQSQSPNDQHPIDELQEHLLTPNNPINAHRFGACLESILNPATTIQKEPPDIPKLDPPPPNITQPTLPHNSIPSWSSNQSSNHHLSIAASIHDDPINLGIISLNEAQELLRYFMDELNPPLALLDRYLHTFDFLRSKCPLLFSVIISTTAKFFRPQIYTQCLQVHKSLMALAAVEEICSIDHIQALIILATWKDPGDNTIERKINRAVGYAYELSLHASFYDDHPTASQPNNQPTNSSHPSTIQRRIKRDRQRTWIILCLYQAIVRKDDGNSRPRPRMIPLQDHPDPGSWYHEGGDITLPIDSRIAWSLDSINVSVEMDNIVVLCASMPSPTGFAYSFEELHRKSAAIRNRWFNVTTNGRQYIPRFPMDKSAILELPFLDAHCSLGMAEATWQWAYKVSTSGVTEDRRNLVGSLSQPRFWFTRTADYALRTLQLFLDNILESNLLHIGHDYLVICAGYAAKWLFLYRLVISPITLVTAHDVLIQIIKKCSQPQRLPTGEIANVQREAPGYLLRYLEALHTAGFHEAVQRLQNAKSHRHERKASENGAKALEPSQALGSYLTGGESKSGPDRHSPYYPSLKPNRPERQTGSGYAGASQRSDIESGRPSSIENSFERGHSDQHGSGLNQTQVSCHVKETFSPASSSVASGYKQSPTNPSYLNESSTSLPAQPSLQQASISPSSWPGHSPSSSFIQEPVHQAGQQTPYLSGPGSNIVDEVSGIYPMTYSGFDTNVNFMDVAPIDADMSKSLLENLGSILDTQDLSYWAGLLGV